MTKHEVMCVKCYKYYVGGPATKYCPECRKKKWSQSAKDHDLCHAGAMARWGKYTKVSELEVRK